jgi:hypothetical protein
VSRKKKKKGASAADRKEEGTFGREEEDIVGWEEVFLHNKHEGDK